MYLCNHCENIDAVTPQEVIDHFEKFNADPNWTGHFKKEIAYLKKYGFEELKIKAISDAKRAIRDHIKWKNSEEGKKWNS